MNAIRVEHGQSEKDEAYIGGITNDLVFKLFPAFHTTFDQNLGTKTETFRGEIPHFLGIVCETTAEPTESERRTLNDGVSDFLCSSESGID